MFSIFFIALKKVIWRILYDIIIYKMPYRKYCQIIIKIFETIEVETHWYFWIKTCYTFYVLVSKLYIIQLDNMQILNLQEIVRSKSL